jgi:penicillin-binding protein 1A
VPVEDSGGVAVRREVEEEDASGTESNAMKEEAARRKAYGEAVRRAEVEEAARRKAHNEAVRRAAEEEAARRRAYGGPSLKGKKKKGLA